MYDRSPTKFPFLWRTLRASFRGKAHETRNYNLVMIGMIEFTEIIAISREMQRSRYICQRKSMRIFFRRSHRLARAVMRLFPVTFLASDSNARASIESYEWPSRRRGYTVVDLLTSCRWRQRRAAVVLRPCDRYMTDWHTTQPTPTETSDVCISGRAFVASRCE